MCVCVGCVRLVSAGTRVDIWVTRFLSSPPSSADLSVVTLREMLLRHWSISPGLAFEEALVQKAQFCPVTHLLASAMLGNPSRHKDRPILGDSRRAEHFLSAEFTLLPQQVLDRGPRLSEGLVHCTECPPWWRCGRNGAGGVLDLHARGAGRMDGCLSAPETYPVRFGEILG